MDGHLIDHEVANATRAVHAAPTAYATPQATYVGGLVVQRTSPIAVKGRIVVVVVNHLCSWSPH